MSVLTEALGSIQTEKWIHLRLCRNGASDAAVFRAIKDIKAIFNIHCVVRFVLFNTSVCYLFHILIACKLWSSKAQLKALLHFMLPSLIIITEKILLRTEKKGMDHNPPIIMQEHDLLKEKGQVLHSSQVAYTARAYNCFWYIKLLGVLLLLLDQMGCLFIPFSPSSISSGFSGNCREALWD